VLLDPAPGRIGQGVEKPIKVRPLVDNHLVIY
jgi:hypothetical protein